MFGANLLTFIETKEYFYEILPKWDIFCKTHDKKLPLLLVLGNKSMRYLSFEAFLCKSSTIHGQLVRRISLSPSFLWSKSNLPSSSYISSM